jgi:hypothetical protein
MNFIRLTTLLLAALLSLSACGKNEESSTPAANAGDADTKLLAYVPSDTPYLAASLEPIPADVIDSYLARMQPVIDMLQADLSTARAELDSTGAAASEDPEAKLMRAVLSEFDGNLSRSGLGSLGIDLGAQKVAYGLGAFPVVRVGLSNAETLRETILRILKNAEISAPEQDFQGVAFWRLADDDSSDVPVGLYVSIMQDHLALGLFPITAEDELLPAFLGLEMPASSDAGERLVKLNRTHGYTSHGSGILEMHALADQFLRPENLAARMMAASGEFDPATLTQECVTEIHGIIDNAPRMTMGVQELSATTIAMQYRVETPFSLAATLADLVAKIPAADKLSERIMDLAFGMKFGAARDFLRQKALAISEQPYQCEHLQNMNLSAIQALEKLNQPLPPFVNNFRGVRISLSEIMMNQDTIPENARGHLAVHVEQPQMFVGMAQMFLPDLAELALQPGSPPVRLPESLIEVPGVIAYAAMSEEAIGIAVGEGEEAGLPDYLDQAPADDGTFFSTSYDMAAYKEYTSMLKINPVPDDSVNDEGDDSMREHSNKYVDALNASYQEMAGRGYVSMGFVGDGLVIDNRVTFKPQ